MGGRFSPATLAPEQRDRHADPSATWADERVRPIAGLGGRESNIRAPSAGFRLAYDALVLLTSGMLAGVLYLGSIHE
jgi:hypothetical protein